MATATAWLIPEKETNNFSWQEVSRPRLAIWLISALKRIHYAKQLSLYLIELRIKMFFLDFVSCYSLTYWQACSIFSMNELTMVSLNKLWLTDSLQKNKLPIFFYQENYKQVYWQANVPRVKLVAIENTFTFRLLDFFLNISRLRTSCHVARGLTFLSV